VATLQKQGPEARLDVSDLEPPEPLLRALHAAESLAPGTYLHMTHRREPHLLYPQLLQRGFSYRLRAGRAGNVELFIWRSDDAEAAAAAERGSAA